VAGTDRNGLLIDSHPALLRGWPVSHCGVALAENLVKWLRCGHARSATSAQLTLGCRGCCLVASHANGRYASRGKVRGVGGPRAFGTDDKRGIQQLDIKNYSHTLPKKAAGCNATCANMPGRRCATGMSNGCSPRAATLPGPVAIHSGGHSEVSLHV